MASRSRSVVSSWCWNDDLLSIDDRTSLKCRWGIAGGNGGGCDGGWTRRNVPAWDRGNVRSFGCGESAKLSFLIPRHVESLWTFIDDDICLNDRIGIVHEPLLMISSVFVVDDEDERAGETGKI